MPYTVVVLSKNFENVFPCLHSVFEHEDSPSIVVVDDGLTARPLANGLRYIPGVKPFVYARNVNEGIRAAGPDHDIVLLNDDAMLETPGGFSALEKAAADHPGFGIIASATNNVGNKRQRHRGMGFREDPRMVCFICVYIPRRTIDAVGLLDEQFVDYGFEDDDYCLRIRNAGLRIGITDECFVNHSKLTSTFRGNGHRPLEPNRDRFIQKWGSHPL